MVSFGLECVMCNIAICRMCSLSPGPKAALRKILSESIEGPSVTRRHCLAPRVPLNVVIELSLSFLSSHLEDQYLLGERLESCHH